MLSQTWSQNNQKYLAANVEQVKVLLEKYVARSGKKEAENLATKPLPEWTEKSPPTIDTICTLFGLSNFEKSVLLLCAGVELYGEVARLCAEAQGNSNSVYPTFGLALAAMPDAHWSAVTPASSLRRFRLIELYNTTPMPLTANPIRIEERVLHYLTGISYFEPQLRIMLRPVRENVSLVSSHKCLVERILFSWRTSSSKEKLPPIQLWGIDETSKLVIAQKACADLGLTLWQLPAEMIPTKAGELDSFIQLWTREAALLESALYISAEDVVDSSILKNIARLVYDIPGPVILGTREKLHIVDQSDITFEVKKPTKMEQLELWQSFLGEASQSLNATISKVVSQFDLNASAVQSASKKAFLLSSSDGIALPKALWDASLEVSRPRLNELAERIVAKAKMDDLVLPEQEKRLLCEISIHVAQRTKVYEEWGFELSSSRGLGITALFGGSSGTGKTMAAEVLANELNLDLFRIDLSMVMSKFIGETEKNLRKVFDAIENGGNGSILFFDEADALFGKRAEIRDSHDRYANIEINYLLQRMESYRGLAILATNMKNAIDPAFIRRIRFQVNFPFPDEKSRDKIWEHIFPPSTPTAGIDFHSLARLNISGGSIRNIAMNAAFLAADEGVPVSMKHLRRAAHTEYAKLERPLTQAELGD
jgi:AAA+ superfamily predicted ATPase